MILSRLSSTESPVLGMINIMSERLIKSTRELNLNVKKLSGPLAWPPRQTGLIYHIISGVFLKKKKKIGMHFTKIFSTYEGAKPKITMNQKYNSKI